MSQTYSSYLKVHEILDLQQPRSEGPVHDEMLFIVIHQVYELWFKQVLHEVDYLQDCLRANDRAHSLHTLRRVLTILKTMVSQIDILETMTPLEFRSFRDRLASASGFQSFQFRELEFVLGYKRANLLRHYLDDPQATARLEQRLLAPTLWDAFLHYLAANEVAIPSAALFRDVTRSPEPNEALQKVLVEMYAGDPHLVRVSERLVDLDEGLQEWRYRHVKMVERTIGSRMGTGGSAGVEYLAATLFKPFFPDLWIIRKDL